MDYILSVLIPSLKNRDVLRERLLRVLEPQLNKNIELLIDIDEGEVSIGVKRQRMLEKAKGKYICFVDDDDIVAPDYIELITDALKGGPDCVGIHLLHYVNGKAYGKTYHSLKHDHWWQEADPDNPGGFLFYRCPNHLNPVKKEHALKAGYPDLRHGEDKVYSEKLYQYLKTERYISEPIYYYYHRRNK